MKNRETYVETTAEFLSAAVFDRVLSSLNHLLAADMLQITPVSADLTWIHHKKSKHFLQKCKNNYHSEQRKTILPTVVKNKYILSP